MASAPNMQASGQLTALVLPRQLSPPNLQSEGPWMVPSIPHPSKSLTPLHLQRITSSTSQPHVLPHPTQSLHLPSLTTLAHSAWRQVPAPSLTSRGSPASAQTCLSSPSRSSEPHTCTSRAGTPSSALENQHNQPLPGESTFAAWVRKRWVQCWPLALQPAPWAQQPRP